MKLIEEIKNSVAVKYGFENFNRFANNCIDIDLFNDIINEVAEQYAKQCCDEQIKACSESATANVVYDSFDGTYDAVVSKKSIVNTPNVVKK